MLKFENTASVGDKIKAFDFKPLSDRDDSYLVGRVVAKGKIFSEQGYYLCKGYTVYVTDSRSGNDKYDMKRIATKVIVPFEVDVLEYDERVSLVEEAA